jgi:hypothetical protein
MTLIVTCLTDEHIAQAADRRLTLPDGSLYDDDTNKAVFFCGRVAVGFTGLAHMEGRPTAEWIALCMKDASQTEAAMNQVAERGEQHLGKIATPDKRLTVVATGWATNRGMLPLRPFLCVASNCMTDSWGWELSAHDRMAVRYRFLEESSSHLVFVAGQNLTREEEVHLNRSVRRAVEHGATGIPLARLAGETIQAVARGGDERAKRVGRAMIVHLLSRKALSAGSSMVVAPLTPDLHSFIYYFSREGRTDRFQGAVVACNGAVLTNFGGGTIPPGGKGKIRTEMEESARRSPIRVPPGATRYSAPCPFCAAESRHRGLSDSPRIVDGELPMADEEAWIYCRGQSGHLLLVHRQRL